MANTYAKKPNERIIPPKKPGKPDFIKALKKFFLYVTTKKIDTTRIKNNDLQKRICQRVAPSKDFTISPPKLRLHAPKKTNKGPGNFEIKFILFGLINYQFPFYKIYKMETDNLLNQIVLI